MNDSDIVREIETTRLIHRQEIVELTSRLLVLVDSRDWDAAWRLFTDVVQVDYTSLNGGAPQTIPAKDLIAGWQTVLEGLDATQHLVGNHLVSVDGDQATCVANVQATHVLHNATGGPIWTVGGRYDFGLINTSAGWRIGALTLTVRWATGNQHITEISARERPKGP
ncbi:nuclear transport factor 2 family protein [Flindersiella endophytica]